MKYDCIVLGVGGIGSAALWAAAERGWNVLGLERFGAVHDQGSSHGRTRIIRTAYFEHPNYVPLCRQAWATWSELQSKSKSQLIQKTGLLQMGVPNGEVISGIRKSVAEHQLPVADLTVEQAAQKFPAIKVPDGHEIVFEEEAGFLRIENCVTELIARAKAAGGRLKVNEKVGGWSIENDGTVVVHGESENFRADKLILTAGPWSARLLPDLELDLQIIRKQQQWFQIDRTDIKYQNGFPCFLCELESGCYYGFPEVDYLGIKVAQHDGGQPVDGADGIERTENTEEVKGAKEFLDRCFNFSKIRLVHHSVCMYSMSRDGHFIVDQHPSYPQVAFACGMSGHGFKFSPVIGKRLVGMLAGEDEELFDFLRMGNRALSVD